jgi:hypothetical protein
MIFYKEKILRRFKLFMLTFLRVRVMVFIITFHNISVISWWSVLLMEVTEVPGENH